MYPVFIYNVFYDILIFYMYLYICNIQYGYFFQYILLTYIPNITLKLKTRTNVNFNFLVTTYDVFLSGIILKLQQKGRFIHSNVFSYSKFEEERT